jgi:aspartate ammonia-lyase
MTCSVEQGCDTRIEKDHIGTVEVPADALFGINTVRALRVYRVHGVPTGDYPEFVQAYARIKKAAAIELPRPSLLRISCICRSSRTCRRRGRWL